MAQQLNTTRLPAPAVPVLPVAASYDEHRGRQTPLIIDNGSTTLRFGFCTSSEPRCQPNIVSKYKERRTNKPLLLFGDGVEAEGGAKSQAKTPWEGDVLLNFDALVSKCTVLRCAASTDLAGRCRRMHSTTRSYSSASMLPLWNTPCS